MLETPLVSVKMITYNHAPYIAQAIEGVLSQKTDFPYELVIGEDCSTDGTREIVLRYAEAHPDVIRVVTSDSNVGSRANSRRTTEACRGKYIAWCEGDDYWQRDDKLQLQVDYLEANRDCVLVHSDFDYLDAETGNVIRSYYTANSMTPPCDAGLSNLLAGQWGIRTCTACARLAVVKEVQKSDPEVYEAHRFLMGDGPLWADLLHRGHVHYVNRSLATYRVLGDSLSRNKNIVKAQRFHTSAAELCVYYARKYGLSLAEIRTYEAKLADARLFLAFLSRNAQLAREVWAGIDAPTFRQRVLVWGSCSVVMNRLLRVLWSLKRRTKLATRGS